MRIKVDLDYEFSLMEHYKLDFLQMYFVKCLINSIDDENDDSLDQFFIFQPDYNVKSILLFLNEVGIIKKYSTLIDDPTKLLKYRENIEFTERFKKNFYKSSFSLYQELRENYPSNLYINGANIDLRTINSKAYKTEADVAHLYGKMINYKEDEHKKIIELLKYGVTSKLINTNIVNFIISRGWERIEKIKNGEASSSIDYDNSRML